MFGGRTHVHVDCDEREKRRAAPSALMSPAQETWDASPAAAEFATEPASHAQSDAPSDNSGYSGGGGDFGGGGASGGYEP